MDNVFEHFYSKAISSPVLWSGSPYVLEGTDIQFQYEIEKYMGADYISLCIMVHSGLSLTTTVFNFSYKETDVLGILITDDGNNEIHRSAIKNEEELEARLFQIQNMINTYDLSVKIYDTMRELHKLYFKEKYEKLK